MLSHVGVAIGAFASNTNGCLDFPGLGLEEDPQQVAVLRSVYRGVVAHRDRFAQIVRQKLRKSRSTPAV